jgi:hypothetical protein
MGLLLANKQLHMEASEILYSKNTFAILIDTEGPRGRTFWNCGPVTYDAPKSPCLVPPRNIGLIKHVMIAIKANEEIHPWGSHYKKELVKLRNRVKDIVTILLKHNVKLKTLEVKFSNTFGGRAGILFDNPFSRHHLYPDVDQTWPLTTAMGYLITLTRTPRDDQFCDGPLGQRCTAEHYGLLDSLLKLQGRVEYFKLRGDLPTKYLRHMRWEMDKGANLSVPIKIMRARDEKFDRERQAFRKAEEQKYIDELETLKAAQDNLVW